VDTRSGGNVIDFVAAMERCSAYDAAKRIDKQFPSGSGHATTAREADAGAGNARHRLEEAEPERDSGRNKALAFYFERREPFPSDDP
jgi:hypothetical protein